ELLLKSRVRVHGICVPLRSSVDGKMIASLLATNANDVTILQLPEETWQRYPVRRINQAGSGETIVHLSGRVRSVKEAESFSLADDTGLIVVETKDAVPKILGRQVEALGEAAGEGSNVVLRTALFRPLKQSRGTGGLP